MIRMILKNKFKMNKATIRAIYWSSVLLFMVFVAFPLFFFFYSFNEEQVKQMLFEQFDNKSYHVTVTGEISPKLWHGLSFEVKGMEIATSTDIPLLQVKTLKCQLSWFDLALGRYRVKRMSLADVTLNEKNLNDYGINNLINSSQIDNSAFSNLKIFYVNNITSIADEDLYPIKNGNLSLYRDHGYTKFNLGLKLDESDTYVSVEGKFKGINDSILKFNDFGINVYNDQMKVKLKTDAIYKLDERELLLTNVKGDINYDGYTGNVLADQVVFNMQKAMANNLDITFNIGDVFANQNVELNVDQIVYDKYKKIYIQRIKTDYKLDIYNSKIRLVSNLENLDIESDQLISKKCHGHLEYDAPNFEKLKSDVDGVCLYQPEKKQYAFDLKGLLNQAPINLNLKINTLNNKPKITLKSNMDKLNLASINTKSSQTPFYYDDSPLPFSWLAAFDMDSELNVKKFTFDRVSLSNLHTEFSLESETLVLNNIDAEAYNGQLSGNARVEKIGDAYNIKLISKLNNLDLQNVFEDLFDVGAISGSSNIVTNISVDKARTYVDLHKLMNGYVSLEAIKGAFQGVDFNLFSDPKIGFVEKSTIFKQLRADFNFTRGISKNGRIVFYSPYVIANGNGLVDFVDNKLDYKLTIKSALPQNEANVQSIVIPVIVNGDLFNPKISIESIHFSDKSTVLRSESTKPRKSYKTKASGRRNR